MILMVLVVGLAGCTKEVDGEYSTSSIYNEPLVFRTGEFEGVWIVDQQEIGMDTLTVINKSFLFRLPEEYLYEKVYAPIVHAPLGERCDCPHEYVGLSDNMTYYFNFNVYNRVYDNYCSGVAIYDKTTDAWTLKITINRNQSLKDGGQSTIDKIPVVLVYIAKRKI